MLVFRNTGKYRLEPAVCSKCLGFFDLYFDIPGFVLRQVVSRTKKSSIRARTNYEHISYFSIPTTWGNAWSRRRYRRTVRY
jgi:hypothetical protein